MNRIYSSITVSKTYSITANIDKQKTIYEKLKDSLFLIRRKYSETNLTYAVLNSMQYASVEDTGKKLYAGTIPIKVVI